MIAYGQDYPEPDERAVFGPDDGWGRPDDDVPAVPVVREMHSGQLRIAERFVAAFSNRLLYVHGIGWHSWTGSHWVADRDGEARRKTIQLLKTLRHESVDMGKSEQERLLADVKKCESSGGVGGVLDLAKYMRPMTTAAEDTNLDATLFNAQNGTLDLETGRLRAHDPADAITKVAGTVVDLAATSDLWDRFLAEVLPDPAVREYLARVLGVALLGRVREHILPILTGTGGNGKGVLIETVLSAFGNYGIAVDPKLIMKTKHERHGTFTADLHGVRLAITSETNSGETLAAATVKQLTGGDKLRANRMRQDPFEFTPSHSLVLITNHRPQVDASDKAMWRRLSVVPFDVTVAEPDVKLQEKLREHLPAILAWVIHGWRDYNQQGMNPPDAVLARTEEYRSESDPLAQFLIEECVTGPMLKVKAKVLFETWSMWAMRSGTQPMTQNEFGKRIGDRFERKRGTGGAYQYVGVGLAADEEQSAGLL